MQIDDNIHDNNNNIKIERKESKEKWKNCLKW